MRSKSESEKVTQEVAYLGNSVAHHVLPLKLMKVLFWLRKNKLNTSGTAPVMCRITVNGVRTSDFSTGVRVAPAQWDAKSQKVRGRNASGQLDNQKLVEMRNRLNSIYILLENSKRPYSAVTVKNLYFGDVREDITLLDCITEYAEYQAKSDSIRKTTAKHFEYTARVVKKFLESSKMLFASEFDQKRLEQFYLYCTRDLKFSNNHTVTKIQHIHLALEHAYHNDKILVMPVLSLPKKSKVKKDLVFLDEKELKQVEEADLPSEEFEKIRDLFVFQCYTGLAYADLAAFNQNNIEEYQGRQWIKGKRVKNDGNYSFPLLDKAKEILVQYNYKLPVIRNDKYNQRLKILGELCYINKKLTTHVGRKTFAVMALNFWDIPLETVAKMLGHATIKTTQSYYVDVIDRKIANDMKNVK